MRFLKIGVLLFVLFTSTSFINIHKYYVSVTDIEFVSEKKSIQIISRLFVDDFDAVLEERFEENIAIDNESSHGFIEKYFLKKMLFKIDAKPVKLKFIGVEVVDDMIYCYLEIENISDFDSLEVTNNIFLETFENQQNITHIKAKGVKKSFLFIKGNSSALLNF